MFMKADNDWGKVTNVSLWCEPNPREKKLMAGETLFSEMLNIIESSVMDVRAVQESAWDEAGDAGLTLLGEEDMEQEIVRIC